jgi:HlyD family secretion protein
VLVAARNLDAARAELARAAADLDKAVIRAPIAGTVLTIHVRPGEKPGVNGVMSLGDLTRMTAELEVYQTQIGQVDVGDPVTVTADALPRPLAGAVTRVGLEVARQTLTDASPAANTDARVVKVYVRLDPDATSVAQRFTNLQVVGRIAVGGRS